MDVMQDSIHMAILLTMITIIALVVIVIVTAVTIGKNLKPIEKIVQAAKDISRGNLDIEIEAKSNDEIGVLAETFNQTANVLKTITREISHILKQLSVKNLDVSINAAYEGDFVEIKDALTLIVSNLNDIVADINQSADQVFSGSEQVSTGAQASNEQAMAIVQVTQGLDQISSVVQTNSATAEESAAASEELSGQSQVLKAMVNEFHLKESVENSQIDSQEEPDEETQEYITNKYE